MARILITSALPYINGVKHLGNLAGSMLPADVLARFCRMRGDEVLFICATDEHGTPAELAAQAEGVDVQAYCDLQHDIQKAACEGFALSFDRFGRTSRRETHRLTQHFADVLEDRGLIEERISRQIFSPTDGRFLPDRYVEGTCPHCGFEKARGDQCDNCGRLLDPVDLIDPYSAVSGARDLEQRDTAHLYLLQSKLQAELRAWVDGADHWPSLARSIAYKWLDEGLQDRAITRDLSWGVPVTRHGSARAGFKDKVFYVWFDAPIGYIGATEEWAAATGADWRRWWRTDEGAADVTYVQFMGKDNVAFHAVSFPTTIIGSGEAWKLVDRLKAFNWITWYGGKFSTSAKRGVFMDQALELLPCDYWRWYLTSNAPESADTAFTWEGFQASINADLANVFGNLINRITKFAVAKYQGRVPEGGQPGAREGELALRLGELIAQAHANFEALEYRKACQSVRAIWVRGNEYLQAAAPWSVIKTDPDEAAMIVRTALNLAAISAIVALPVIPSTASAVLDALGVEDVNRRWPSWDDTLLLDALARGLEISAPPILFAKIEDEQVAEWTTRFGGSTG
jgi:methionyl-tRNA synthetase